MELYIRDMWMMDGSLNLKNLSLRLIHDDNLMKSLDVTDTDGSYTALQT